MKSTKHQAPNSRETSSTKHQPDHLPIATREWWDEEALYGALVLKDEVPRTAATRHPFDLEERPAVFGEDIVRFSKKVPRHPPNNRLIHQLLEPGTSQVPNTFPP